jgi:hypothetical protein
MENGMTLPQSMPGAQEKNAYVVTLGEFQLLRSSH